MTFRKFVNALQTIHTIMVNNAKNATCPGTGTSPLSNAKNAPKKATTILSLKSALPAQRAILFGMAQYAPTVQFKVQYGTESIVTTAHLVNTGTLLCRNAFHAQLVKPTTQLKINAFVLLKRPSC